MDRGFGWQPVKDARDARFPMSALLTPLKEIAFPRGFPPGFRHFRTGPVLDQGNTGTCVAHAWSSLAQGAPVMQDLPWHPFQFYRRIIRRDEFPQNDSEITAPDNGLQFGTSVRAGAEELKSQGYILSYLWAQVPEDLRSWILAGLGNAALGTVWKADMMSLDSDGFVRYTGETVGGHAYLAKGWNDNVRRNGRFVPALRCQNSWGEDWGQRGFFWIELSDLDKMFADWGEFCAPSEVRVQPR